MDFVFQKRNRSWVIAITWALVALLLTTKASFGQLHERGFSIWYQNFFFQGSGALIWALLTPFLISFTKKYNLASKNFKKALLAHILLSIPVALMHRTFAMMVDFLLRDMVNMGFLDSWSPFYAVYQFRFMILSSAVSNLFAYWIIVQVLSTVGYYLRVRNGDKTDEAFPGLDKIKVKVQGVYRLIPLDEVVSFESSGNYISIFTQEETFRIRETMKVLETQLSDSFLRVHRSSIININYLENFEHLYQGEYLLRMKNGRQVTSTKSYKKNLQTFLASTDR